MIRYRVRASLQEVHERIDQPRDLRAREQRLCETSRKPHRSVNGGPKAGQRSQSPDLALWRRLLGQRDERLLRKVEHGEQQRLLLVALQTPTRSRGQHAQRRECGLGSKHAHRHACRRTHVHSARTRTRADTQAHLFEQREHGCDEQVHGRGARGRRRARGPRAGTRVSRARRHQVVRRRGRVLQQELQVSMA